MKHRLGIYLIYDKDGIVDEYVFYYLNQLKSVVSRIVVVCNGVLKPECRDRLEAIVDEVFCRENTGFDAWAYKTAIEHVGWKSLLNYDELVITNYTIFGPFYSFEKMFDDMEKNSDADFWGIHRRYKDQNLKYFCGRPTKHGYMPEYPLSNFWVIRSSLLHSYDFKKYWDNLPPINDYIDACIVHEPVFTKTMCDAGYIMDAYSPAEIGNTCPTPTVQNVIYQLQEEQLPVIRRRAFINPLDHFLRSGYGGDVQEIFDYIKENTEYDTSMMLENLIRTTNMYDLYERFNWNYIISDSQNRTKPYEQVTDVALIMHIFYADLVGECKRYVLNFPAGIKMFITTTSEETKNEIEKQFSDVPAGSIEIQIIPNRGRDISSLIIAAKDFICKNNFKYVCFFHDKKMPHLQDKKSGEEFKKRCYTSIMGTSQVVNNVISLFEENQQLGIISSPPPYHGEYYQILGGSWTGNYDLTVDLIQKLGLKVEVSSQKPPVAPYGTCFWFRPEALMKLFEYDFSYEVFPEEPIESVDDTIMHAIERVYPFVAQDAGFYSAYVLTDENASTELSNLMYMLRTISDLLRSHHIQTTSYAIMIKNLQNYFKKMGENTKKLSVLSKKTEVPNKKINIPNEEININGTGEISAKNEEELLEVVPTKLLIKKLIKRLIPNKIWIYLRKKKWQHSGSEATIDRFEEIIQNEELKKQ